jgi:hypothetical protein
VAQAASFYSHTKLNLLWKYTFTYVIPNTVSMASIHPNITRKIPNKPSATTATTATTGYHCALCGKTYKLKDNYNKHYVSCAFFHKKCMETNDEFNDSLESIPTQHELYQFIKQIAIKCQRLEEEVATLKQHLNMKQRQNIMDILNHDPKNSMRTQFDIWCAQIQVSREHLDAVFDGSLMCGIKVAMETHISSRDTLPMRAFKEKNTLYIYDSDRQWKAATNACFEKLIASLEKQFLQVFLEWQKENQEQISKSEKLKDDEIHYMMKICGYKYTGDKHAILKKWIMETIAE